MTAATAVRGRPRDPQLAGRVLSTATQILAARGMAGFTSDEIAASAGVGKASIYRRWTTLHGLLVEVIEDLGVRAVTYTEGTSGRRAMAEAAVLSTVGFDADLRQAYARGPVLRFFQASRVAQQRAVDRGEPWPTLDPVQTGWTSLIYRLAVSGHASSELVEDVVDRVVLPALRTVEVAW
jgi:AcrR family transcriptional regulator